MQSLARRLSADGVPFFVTQGSGMYDDVYVTLPGTGKVAEGGGDRA